MQLRENSNEIHMNCAHYSLKGWRSVSQFLLMGKPWFISKFEEFGEESSTDYWPGGDSLGCELLRGGYCSVPHWLVFRRPSVSPQPSRVITVSSFPRGLSLLISHHELGLLFWIIPMVLIKFLKIPMRWGKLERRTREVNLRQTLILLVVKVEKGNWINVRASRSQREKRKCVFPQSLQNISVLPTPWFRLARPSMVSDLRVRR